MLEFSYAEILLTIYVTLAMIQVVFTGLIYRSSNMNNESSNRYNERFLELRESESDDVIEDARMRGYAEGYSEGYRQGIEKEEKSL